MVLAVLFGTGIIPLYVFAVTLAIMLVGRARGPVRGRHPLCPAPSEDRGAAAIRGRRGAAGLPLVPRGGDRRRTRRLVGARGGGAADRADGRGRRGAAQGDPGGPRGRVPRGDARGRDDRLPLRRPGLRGRQPEPDRGCNPRVLVRVLRVPRPGDGPLGPLLGRADRPAPDRLRRRPVVRDPARLLRARRGHDPIPVRLQAADRCGGGEERRARGTGTSSRTGSWQRPPRCSTA